MTTKPKAKKFRIRRSGTLGQSERAQPVAQAQPTPKPPADPAPQPKSSVQGDVAAPADLASEVAISEIRKEGLTGRQLRMARRVAHKHGLAPTSDFDAVRLLRAKGVDPFERSNMLELVVADQNYDAEPQQKLPQTVQPSKNLPSTHVSNDGERAREIIRIQRDIARRRRRRMLLLLTRLSFFVFLPTLLAGYYYYVVATPMYATKSEFLIQQAESQAGGGLGSMFAGTQFATTQDSITVQSYLQSRDAMLRLDQDKSFKAHFSQPDIDAIQRLDENASNEAAYRLFKRHVKIGYDPTEGIIKMEVIAAAPDVSAEFSKSLISYAEEQVDNLTQRLRKDQMSGARESFEDAEAKMLSAQQRVQNLQEKLGVVNAEGEVAAIMGQISQFEVEMTMQELALQELKDNARPNATKVGVAERKIARLSVAIDDLRAKLTNSGSDSDSLAKITGELRIAETDLVTRQLLLQQSLQQLETARIEANRQVRYLSIGVSPSEPDEAAYPRAFENTVLAFLILAGVYLMASLTASILREQV